MVEKIEEHGEASREGVELDNQPDQKNPSNVSNFGTSLIALALSFFCAFCVWYVGPSGSGIVPFIIDAILYVLTVIFAFAFVALLANALIQAPMVRRFLLLLLGLSSGGKDGWGLFFIGCLTLLAASLIHLILITIVGLAGLGSYIVEILVAALLIPTIFWLCLSADELLFKPFNNAVQTDEEELQSMVKRVRRGLAVVLPILVGLVSIIQSLL